jgi:hypothetical protein
VTAFLDRELVVPAAEVPQAPDEPLGLARRIGRRLRSTLARRAS